MTRYAYDHLPKSESEFYDTYKADELKSLARAAVLIFSAEDQFSADLSAKIPTRKSELLDMFKNLLSSQAGLRKVYANLNELQQAAVQEAVFGPKDPIDWSQFRAKYGGLPDRTVAGQYQRDKTTDPLCLLMTPSGAMPKSFRERLKEFVPAPRVARADTVSELPRTVEMAGGYKGKFKANLVAHETESAALHDVTAVLRMVDSGAIGASERSGRVSDAGAKTVRKILLGGDFYPEGLETEGSQFDVPMGKAGIRPFAWPLIVQAGGLAKVAGGRIRAMRAGRTAAMRAPQEILRELWNRWIDNKLLHEMNRVSAIKGQMSKGRPLAAAPPCRRAVMAALKELPAGEWISMEAFFNFLIARGHGFDVADDEWRLYIGDPQYGSFGCNAGRWEHLSGRFTRTFLLEYAATLGLIDVALTPPWNALGDLRDFWGTDSMSCLSRYDGLRYLRLNPLGEWILGRTESYRAKPLTRERILRVLPNHEITVSAPTLPPADRLFLERICEKTSERVWRLSKRRLLKALEEGLRMDAIIGYLAAKSDDDLPQTTAIFLKDAEKRAFRVKDMGPARLIECLDKATAALICSDPRLKRLCLPAGTRQIVVFGGKEAAFRRAIRELGFALTGYFSHPTTTPAGRSDKNPVAGDRIEEFTP